MKKVAFYTLGCKVNQFETHAMEELFSERGYEVVDPEERADIYVINTCTVTNMSERKSRQIIRKAKRLNKDSIVAVVGCYSQVAPNEVLNIEGVDLIIGTNNRNMIVDLCQKAEISNHKINAVDDIMDIRKFEEMTVGEITDKTRAFIKIQEGCNQYCSYCIIPYARGQIRSRELGNIENEVKKLAEKGFKEIVLTGIHIASYGKDLGDVSLIDVIENINTIEGIERIRLSSLEPTIVTKEFMERLSKLNKVCDHFHLSLQSGSDTVLKRMNRKYTTDQYRNIVNLIREYDNDSGITTDIIVGFPGETEKEFSETYEFVKEIGFSRIHVFKYSPRKGTPAAKFKNQVNGYIKNDRSKILIELGHKLMQDFNKRFADRTMEVLFEEESTNKKGYVEGYTTNYIRVLAEGNRDLEGMILPVNIKDVEDDSLIGTIKK